MFRSTVWALCLIWMTNAIGAHAGIYHELIYCCETKEAIFTNRVLNCIFYSDIYYVLYPLITDTHISIL